MSRRRCRLRIFRAERARALAGGAVFAIGLAALAPAIGQDRPESILPPGFGDPQPARPAPRAQPRPAASAAPRPAATPRPAASPVQGAPSALIPPGAFVQPLPMPSATPTDLAVPTPTPTPVDPAALAEYEMPAFARRSLDRVGPATVREGTLDADAFGNADGRYIEALMRHLAAPLPSRWASILLRRTLVATLDTPRGVGGADFAAERAWLLLRMGEAQGARAVVQSVDNANYTPKLYQVALNAELAASDPAGLCPLADGGARATGERAWVMAQAMCAALGGNAAGSAPLLKQAQRRRVATGIDLLLAQKVAGAGANGRQAVTIEWGGVDALTVWRFGLATATGVAIPDSLYADAAPQVTYWRALSPSVPLIERIGAAEAAAGQGVLSNAALVDFYGALDGADDVPGAAAAAVNDLRTAYVGQTADARLSAMRSLWGSAATVPYPRLVLTARAAAFLPVAQGSPDADRLIASMLTAGLDRHAMRWSEAVTQGSDGWAMLKLADPDGTRESYGTVSNYAGSGGGDAAVKQRFFFAALAGLGRLSPDDVTRGAKALDVRIGADTAWTRALDQAVAERQAGTVALLVAVGMQTPAWGGVPPEMLYRMVAGLREVGLDGEARMIAAEAIARA